MSSDPRRSGRSPAAEEAAHHAATLGEASLVRVRGEALLDALEARVPGSRRHADAAAAYAFATAVELDFDRSSCELIREAARLHDIGQLYVPAELLAREPAGLSAREHAQLEEHVEAGRRLGLGAGLPEQVCDWLMCSRERFDGLGRPGGLAGARIPAPSRIIRAACAYDVALAQAPAPSGARRPAALARLREVAGVELDARVVEALATIVERAAAATRSA
jgi:HD-GYP domain-containing protein (c-di-GMP phosphodiesterase class II)